LPETVGDGDGVEEEDVGGFGLRDVVRIQRVVARFVHRGVLAVDDEVGVLYGDVESPLYDGCDAGYSADSDVMWKQEGTPAEAADDHRQCNHEELAYVSELAFSFTYHVFISC